MRGNAFAAYVQKQIEDDPFWNTAWRVAFNARPNSGRQSRTTGQEESHE